MGLLCRLTVVASVLLPSWSSCRNDAVDLVDAAFDGCAPAEGCIDTFDSTKDSAVPDDEAPVADAQLDSSRDSKDVITIAAMLGGRECLSKFEPGQGVWRCTGQQNACAPGWALDAESCSPVSCPDGCCTATLMADVAGPGGCVGPAYYVCEDAYACLDTLGNPLEGLFEMPVDGDCFVPVLCPTGSTWREADVFGAPPIAAVAVQTHSPLRILVGNSRQALVVEGDQGYVLDTGPLATFDIAAIGTIVSTVNDPFADGAIFATRRVTYDDFPVAAYFRWSDRSVVGISLTVDGALFGEPRFASDPMIKDRYYLGGVATRPSLERVPALAVSDDAGQTWEKLVDRGGFSNSHATERVWALAVARSEPAVLLLVTENRVLLWSDDATDTVREDPSQYVASDLVCDIGRCTVAVTSFDGPVFVGIVSPDGGLAAPWREFNLGQFRPSLMKFAPDGRLVVAGFNLDASTGAVSDHSSIRVLSPDTGEIRRLSVGLPDVRLRSAECGPLMHSEIRGLAVSPDSPYHVYVNLFLVPSL